MPRAMADPRDAGLMGMTGNYRPPRREHVGLCRTSARAMPVLDQNARRVGAIDFDLPCHRPGWIDMIAERKPHHALAGRSVLAQEGIESNIMVADCHDQLRVEPSDRGDLRHAVPDDGKLFRNRGLLFPSDARVLGDLWEIRSVAIQDHGAQGARLSEATYELDESPVRGRGGLVRAVMTIASNKHDPVVDIERVGANDL